MGLTHSSVGKNIYMSEELYYRLVCSHKGLHTRGETSESSLFWHLWFHAALRLISLPNSLNISFKNYMQYRIQNLTLSFFLGCHQVLSFVDKLLNINISVSPVFSFIFHSNLFLKYSAFKIYILHSLYFILDPPDKLSI